MLKNNFKLGVFCLMTSMIVGIFGGCAVKNSVIPNELEFAQCFNEETNTAKNCQEIDFKKVLESKKEWKIISYHYKGDTRTSVQGENPLILRFSNSKIDGTFGCNQFFGNYLIKENYLTLNHIGMTRKMCEPRVMIQEDIMVQHFLNAPTKILVIEEVK